MSHLERPPRKLCAIALLILVAVCVSSAAHAASILDLSSLNYDILSADGRQTLGHGRYLIDRRVDGIVLRGESHYLAGDYDLETDTLSAGSPTALPILEKYDHVFYSADGTLTRESHANFINASGSCIQHGAAESENSETIDFPHDTWAGASVLIPIQQFLMGGGAGELDLHVFNCTSQPSVYAVVVTVAPEPSGPDSPPGAVQVDARPHFGWYDMFIAPFVPKLNAWFNPERGWGFEGVAIARYYKGPQILIMRSASQSPEAARETVVVPPKEPKK
ncbi:MAG: hypothetical protein ACLQDV_13370 [Candidatus Binataceae bacterium]